MRIGNLHIGTRLIAAFSLISVLFVAMGLFALQQMDRIGGSMHQALIEAQLVSRTKDMAGVIDELNLAVLGYLSELDPGIKPSRMQDIEKHTREFSAMFAELEKQTTDAEGSRLHSVLQTSVHDLIAMNARVLSVSDEASGTDAVSGASDVQGTQGYEAAGGAKDAGSGVWELYRNDSETQLLEQVKPALAEIIRWREQRMLDADRQADATNSVTRFFMIVSLVLALSLSILLAFLITRSIVPPLAECLVITGHISDKIFTDNIPDKLAGRGDEIGDLARAFDTMLTNIRGLLKDVVGTAATVAGSAADLSSVSTQTAGSVQQLSGKTTLLAAAAEQSSVNTSNVADNMEQTTRSLSMIASATEQMSATIGEIASNTEKTRNISRRAGEQAVSVSVKMEQLGQAAHEIGKVTETINEISSQTKLLALNATIEAARAGAAGKGFSVVAGEIKELARQTAAATDDIRDRITAVQSSSTGAVEDIARITTIIMEVEQLVSSIAAAIEEQAVVTRDVAGNITKASAGVQEANESIAQTAVVARATAADVAAISQTAIELRTGGEQVQSSAVELTMLAEKLKDLVAQFVINGGTDTARPADSLLGWNPALSVGNATMDQHHQQLFKLIAEFHQALKEGKAVRIANEILERLEEYTRMHFRTEELLLEEAGYTRLNQQKQAHSHFIGKILELRSRWSGGDLSVSSEMMQFLNSWLLEHIKRMDKEYSDCVQTHSSKEKNSGR